jgi:hypothetical protein
LKGYMKDDVKLKRGSDGPWITLREARLDRIAASKNADAAAEAMPPPPAKPSAPAAAPAAGNGSDDTQDRYPDFKPSACYTEDIDDRIRRMIKEGKFDAQIKALNAGMEADNKHPSGASMGALGLPTDDGVKDAADTQGGAGKRGREDEGDANEGGDQGKKARTGGGAAPVKEPKVPVEIPTEHKDVVDPRPERQTIPKTKGGKKKKKGSTDDEKPTLDLPIPIFAEEKEDGEMMAPEGGTLPKKDDGYQSDDSWDKKPGTLEDPEEIEREKREKELERARRETEARAAEERAAGVAKAEAEARLRKKEEEELLAKIDPEDLKLAKLARDPEGGDWSLPNPGDGWRWTKGDSTSLQDVELELGGGRMTVVRRAEDDSYRVVSGDGAGPYAGGAKDARQNPVAARMMAHVFDAVMKNKKRLFFEMVMGEEENPGPLAEWMQADKK